MQKKEDTKIDELLNALNVSQLEFADKLGMDTKRVSDWKRRELGISAINRITDAYPQVSTIWLLKGEGPIIQMESTLTEELCAMMETRPRLPMNFSEDRISEYLEGSKQYLCDANLLIKQLPKYDFTIILTNERMAPKYETGDELAFKKVKYPQWGCDFLFDTPDGALFRKLFEEGENYRCSSYDSRKYPDILIPKSEVPCIYQCVGLLRHS